MTAKLCYETIEMDDATPDATQFGNTIDENCAKCSNPLEMRGRRMGSSLSGKLYQFLLEYVKGNCKRFPPKDILIHEMSKTMHNDAKKSYNRVCKKFRNWGKRMRYENGNLIHKHSNKIIIPESAFAALVKSIHESHDNHLSDHETAVRIQKYYTWGSKEFGMSWIDIAKTLIKCPKSGCSYELEKICKRRRIVFDSNDHDDHQFSFEEILNRDLEMDNFECDQNEDCHVNCHANLENTDKEEENMQINEENSHQLIQYLDAAANELFFRINFMKSDIQLTKVPKFAKKNDTLKQNISQCQMLVKELNSILFGNNY